MKKIYRFDSLNQQTLSIDELQDDPNTVVLEVHAGDRVLVLPFDRDEFSELCNMRYRLDFPVVTAENPALTLVAA